VDIAAVTLPWAPVPAIDLVGERPIMVLAPHPDDETLGCGTLLSHAFDGSGAHVVCLTDGAASHPGSRSHPPAALARTRRAELEQAVTHLGGSVSDVTWLGLPDGALGTVTAMEVADRIAALADKLGVQHVFAPAQEDAHEDHKATARIARLLGGLRPELEIWAYPVWSRWDEPDFCALVDGHRPVTLDGSAFRIRKSAAINAHASQLGGVIEDDPTGFRMAPGFVDRFLEGDEIFWRVQR
jgi:LmbE family N-acetylglucosaminyl deacetylase